MSDIENLLGAKIDQLAELVITRFISIDQRLQGLEGDAAEMRGLLRAIVTGIERLSARMPTDYAEPIPDSEDTDDGFLTPPPGHFLH